MQNQIIEFKNETELAKTFYKQKYEDFNDLKATKVTFKSLLTSININYYRFSKLCE